MPPFPATGKKKILPPLPVSIATVPKITNCSYQSPEKKCKKCGLEDVAHRLQIIPWKAKGQRSTVNLYLSQLFALSLGMARLPGLGLMK